MLPGRPRAHVGNDEFQAISRLSRARNADFYAFAQLCRHVLIFGNAQRDSWTVPARARRVSEINSLGP
jgi:hypothetical protein